MLDSYRYDVFVSFAKADETWVRDDLIPRLEGAGLRVITELDFPPGSPLPIAREKAITESAKTLLILSPSFFSDNWGQFEALMIQSDDPTNEQMRLIPLLLSPVDLPRRLSIFKYVDLTPGNLSNHKLGWKQLIAALGGEMEKTVPGFPRPQFLEPPSGAVNPSSPFYIQRPADDFLKNQTMGAGTITTIHAGRHAGKTSLLMRAIQSIQEKNQRVIFLDFQTLDASHRESLNDLLYYVAFEVGYQLGIDSEIIDRIWKSPRSATNKLNQFFHDEVLETLDAPLLLAIDEADRLINAPFKSDFFALLRSWNSLRAYDDTWRKLNLIIVISTHPYLLIDDINQSPFNVGLTIVPEDFTMEQIADLNRRHGSPLKESELADLRRLVGGHPYLVRQAFYTIVMQGWDLPRLLREATNTSRGPFRRHLQFYRENLKQNPELLRAMQRLSRTGKCPDDEELLDRLSAVGLVIESGGSCEPRCGLYADYFKERLT